MIIDFIKSYYREIIDIILVIISVVFFIIRKKPIKVVDTIREVICRVLPGAICSAEGQDLKGDAKRVFALSIVKEIIIELGYAWSDDYEKFAGDQLEIILSTPSKKGVNYGKK